MGKAYELTMTFLPIDRGEWKENDPPGFPPWFEDISFQEQRILPLK